MTEIDVIEERLAQIDPDTGILFGVDSRGDCERFYKGLEGD